MDVQAKINCSLDDLIKLQRRAPRGAVGAVGTTSQKKTASQRPTNRGGINKKPQNLARQRPSNPRQPLGNFGRQQQKQVVSTREQQKKGIFARQQQQKPFQKQQRQQVRTPTVAEKINLPLDTVISKQHKWEQQQKKQRQQKKQQKTIFAVGKRQPLAGRRAGFLASRDALRRGRLQAAADAARAASRSAAAKSFEAVRSRGVRMSTPQQQVVETLKSAAAFKPSVSRLNRSNYVFAKDRARMAAAGGGRRFANGRLLLRRQPPASAAVGAASRANTSLARRRPLGPMALGRRSTTAPTKVMTAYPEQKNYTAPAVVAPRPVPIDRRRPASPLAEATPAFALEPDMLANIKIMATLDTVPAPLPQQRGAHVAIPAAMQQQQQQQPPRAVGADTLDSGTLSSRFGY